MRVPFKITFAHGNAQQLQFNQLKNNRIWFNLDDKTTIKMMGCWYKPEEDHGGKPFKDFMDELTGKTDKKIPFRFIEYCFYYNGEEGKSICIL